MTSQSVRSTAATILVCSLLAAMLGCSTTNYVSLRKTPRNPLAGPLGLWSRSGPQPTQRTEQFLRNNDMEAVVDGDPRQMLVALQRRVASEPSATGMYAISELAYIAGKRADADEDEALALEMYSAAVAHAYAYLLDSRFDTARNPYDPQYRRACELYNGGLEGALRIVTKRGDLRPGFAHTISTGDQQFEVKVVARGRWRTEEFDRFDFVNDYEVTGLTNHYRTYGLGVPLIAVRKDRATDSVNEKFYPPGVTFPVTAFLRVCTDSVLLDDETQGRKTIHSCQLELYDPLYETETLAERRAVPLESDLSVPLAYFLNQPSFEQNIGLAGFLDVNELRQAQGIYMLEPYDPKKIPVVLVHGLLSSPITWTEMYNDLRADRELGQKYQFWFYLYPTGQPFWVSAAQMRVDLADALKTLDPDGRNEKLDQMVLVGHSMGGLLSKLQTIDSRDDYWHLVSDGSAGTLRGSREHQEALLMTLYFKPNPSVKRVVTIGTPHRGSEHSNSFTRWATRSIAELPNMLLDTKRQLVRDNPDLFRNTDLLYIDTGVESLATSSPFFPVMLQSQPGRWVTYHNIVGDADEDDSLIGRFASRISGRGDGIVSLASSRIDGVASEEIVPAKHTEIHRHPKAIYNVRQILRQHLRELEYEQQYRVVGFERELPRQPQPRRAYRLKDHYPAWRYDEEEIASPDAGQVGRFRLPLPFRFNVAGREENTQR